MNKTRQEQEEKEDTSGPRRLQTKVKEAKENDGDGEPGVVSNARRRPVHLVIHQSLMARANGYKAKRSNSAAVTRGNSSQRDILKSIGSARSPSTGLERMKTGVIGARNFTQGASPFTSQNATLRNQAEKRLKELMANQFAILNFHKKQFESILKAEINSSYLPE